jgi:hypothetical protein
LQQTERTDLTAEREKERKDDVEEKRDSRDGAGQLKNES